MTVILFKNNEIVPTHGGISRINWNLCNALLESGVNCYFLSLTHNSKIASDDRQKWLPNSQCAHCEENILWLSNFIRDNNVDVIINSTFDQKLVQMLDEARKGTQCRLITWIHNNIIEYGSLVGFRKELSLRERHLGFLFRLITCNCMIYALRLFSKRKHSATAQACYQHSDRIITTHDGNIREYISLLGHKDIKNKVLSIPNFVLERKEEVTIEDKEKCLVWCGTIDFELKKTNWMLEIWRRIQSMHPDWKLVIIGDGKSLEDIKRYANHLGVERVIFTGRINPEPYYKKASILCSTSISESFGLTIVEGMQNGVVPIAFASSPAIRDIVGCNGKLIKPYNRMIFSDELSKLMNNVSYREYLAEKCLNASKPYEENQVVKLWLRLFKSI